MPLHPAIVHLPLGLAFIIPLLAAGLFLAVRRGRLPRAAWIPVVVLQAVLVLGAIAAQRTGEADEERVEKVVAEAVLERHEELATVFLAGAGVTLLLAGAALWPRRDSVAMKLAGTAVVASLVVAGIGVTLGHAGGELVYRHGAASVYGQPGSAQPGGAPALPEADDD